jgi:hypothetical protein
MVSFMPKYLKQPTQHGWGGGSLAPIENLGTMKDHRTYHYAQNGKNFVGF